MHIRRALVPFLLAASAALTSCGGDDGEDSADDSPSSSGEASQPSGGGGTESGSGDPAGEVVACDLLSTDEVAAAVGTAVKPGVPKSGEPITGGTFSSCLWMTAAQESPLDQAQLYVYSNTAAADSVRSDDSPEVAGIGDAAFTQYPAAVWVYLGEQSFMAQWYTVGGSEEENLPKSEALARAAAEKLADAP